MFKCKWISESFTESSPVCAYLLLSVGPSLSPRLTAEYEVGMHLLSLFCPNITKEVQSLHMPLEISSFQLLSNTGKQNSIDLIIPTVQTFWLCNFILTEINNSWTENLWYDYKFALTKIWAEYYNYLYTKLKRTADSAKTIPINKCLFIEKSMLDVFIFRWCVRICSWSLASLNACISDTGGKLIMWLQVLSYFRLYTVLQ